MMLRAWSAVGAKLRLAGARGERVCGGAPLARAAFTRGFLDLHKMANKEAIEKEKARLTDEMSRGYFADISEIRKNAGKIAMANKIIIPEIAAMRFPDLAVESPDGRALQLPLVAPTPQDDDREAGDAVVPDASLVCLSFRASSLVNIIVVLCFLTLFLGLELFFFSSVLGSVADGSWVLLVFAAVLYLVMYIWNYGAKLKYETEVKQKLSMYLLMELGCNLRTVRAPGIGLLYNELVRGVPAIFGHFLTTMPVIHSMIIFVCIKCVPVPVVPQNERFLFRRVCPKSYHMFRCIARYGYKDVRKENPQAFEQLLIESLEKFIRREAQERSLESDGNVDTDSEEEVASASSRVLVGPNGSIYSLGVPLLAESAGVENPTLGSSTSFDGSLDEALDGRRSLDNELSFIHKAKESGVVYLLGDGDIRARKDSFFVKKLVINYFYAFLRKNCRRGVATLSIPHTRLMQVAMQYMV